MILEETWRRNEANMRRKQMQAPGSAAAAAGLSDSPIAPSTGAMDALLEKLRAAAPQTKDTRDRRRRARLKDRHQVRVASGQKIPQTGENVEDENSLAPSTTGGSENASGDGGISEGEDIADRAASMLQGLRGEGDGDGPARDDSLRVRRRRESADDERARRRARRRAAGTSAEGNPQSPITEEPGAEAELSIIVNDAGSTGSQDDGTERSSIPKTVVVPPSPTVEETMAAESAQQ